MCAGQCGVGFGAEADTPLGDSVTSCIGNAAAQSSLVVRDVRCRYCSQLDHVGDGGEGDFFAIRSADSVGGVGTDIIGDVGL